MYIDVCIYVCVPIYLYMCVYIVYTHFLNIHAFFILIFTFLTPETFLYRLFKVHIMTPSVQFSLSVMSDSLQPHDCCTPGLPVHHQLLEVTQTHVH